MNGERVITLSREERVREGANVTAPARLTVEGDSESGEVWIWLMFYLAADYADGRGPGADEPWVEVTIEEAKQIRDKLSELITTYGGDK